MRSEDCSQPFLGLDLRVNSVPVTVINLMIIWISTFAISNVNKLPMWLSVKSS